MKKIALLGNPNVGKSTIFNKLTGLQQKVGNFPGVTVDKQEGECKLPNQSIAIIDLPGSYSLYPTSTDEKIVVDYLLDNKNIIDGVIYIADSTQLERHLLLLTQLIDLKLPCILALTMNDVAKSKNIDINVTILEQEFHVPILCVNGRTGEGFTELKESIEKIISTSDFDNRENIYELSSEEAQVEKKILTNSTIETRNAYERLLYAHNCKHLLHISSAEKSKIEQVLKSTNFQSTKYQIHETLSRFAFIEPLLKKAIKSNANNRNEFTQRIDSFLTHPIIGPIVFVMLMLFMFQLVFSVAQYPMDWIEGGLNTLSEYIANLLPKGFVNDLITKGLIAGITGVLVFVPQIAILFFFITLLEEVGYMSRGIYLFDSIMQRFGLNGRSLIALVSGGACAIPAIMSTRTIQNSKERLITILVTPLIACSARIPVFAMLVALIIPSNKSLFLFSYQSLFFVSLYSIGIIFALISSLVFKYLLHSKELSFLALEMPEYKSPHWRNMLTTIYQKVKSFVIDAGKMIVLVSIVLWFLSSFSLPGKMKQDTNMALQYAKEQQLSNEETQRLVAAKRLESSFAGMIGKAIEPAIQPLGFDWKIGIAIISSFAAREVFVGTMNTIYRLSDDESDNQLLREKLQKEINYKTGKPIFNFATCVSLLLFYVFALQCISTLAVVKKETQSYFYPFIQFVYMGLLAYISSFLAYQLLQ